MITTTHHPILQRMLPPATAARRALRSPLLSCGRGLGAAAGALLTGASLLVGACASLPPPTAQIALSNAAVGDAISAGGAQFDPADLRAAQDKLDRANVAVDAHNYIQAGRLAQDAQVDAQLAGARARTAKAVLAATQAEIDNQVLRQEIERSNR